MRLNFSGVDEDDIREGVRRIGEVVREQVELYGTLTGAAPAAAPCRSRAAGAGSRPGRRAAPAAARRARRAAPTRDEPRRGAQGRRARSSARCRCAPARGSRTRSSASATTWSPIDVGARPRRAAARDRARRGVRRAARPRRRGRHGPGAARDPRASRTPRSGVSACMRCADKVLAKHAMRDAGMPTPDFYSFTETAFKELGAAEALRRDRGAPRVPDRRQAGRPGQRAGDQVRARAGRRAGGARRRVLLLAQGAARAPRRRARPRRLGARRRARCRSSRRCRARRTSTTSRRATRSARTELRLPGRRSATSADRARAGARARRSYGLLGCRGFARVDLMLEEATGELLRARGQRDPRADRDEPAAAGRGGGGHRLRRADRADRRRWRWRRRDAPASRVSRRP